MKPLLSTIILAAMLITIAANPAAAQEPRYQLPEVPTVQLSGAEHKCLNVDEWKVVLLIANEYQKLYDWRLVTQVTLSLHQDTLNTYELMLGNYAAQVEMLHADRDYLQLRLNSEVGAAKKTQRLASIERGLLWGLVAVEAIVIGILGVKGYTHFE